MAQRRPRSRPNADPVLSAGSRLGNAIRIYGADSPQAEAARVAAKTASAELYIRRIVEQAPPLPEETRRRLAAILTNPAGSETEGRAA
ncbi:hypothetical protein [Micromonospora globbae]|uniref:hypothetical protein n=1 Tax=Micromonospora globbae TaxID=1894969 RepID=UPI0038676DC1|nr:hypothetical protein OH732_25905 [Micromonospora globbae]